MEYRNGARTAQAAALPRGGGAMAAPCLADTNINPATGLASDYLNHFNEAIMLLDMVSSCPDCREDFLGWRPMSYRDHFAASRFQARDLAIAAYDASDPALRRRLDRLAGTMTAVLEAARAAMDSELPPQAVGNLAHRVAARLKPLVARAGALINGDAEAIVPLSPQAVVDGLMKQ